MGKKSQAKKVKKRAKTLKALRKLAAMIGVTRREAEEALERKKADQHA
jgi:hypothetical protein